MLNKKRDKNDENVIMLTIIGTSQVAHQLKITFYRGYQTRSSNVVIKR